MKRVLKVEQAFQPNDDIAKLIQALDAHLHKLYPPNQSHGLPLEKVFSPSMRFFVLTVTRKNSEIFSDDQTQVDGVSAGCGGVCIDHETAELKRMFVRDDFRGLGGAKMLLRRICDCARDEGVKVLFLETGRLQVEGQKMKSVRQSVS